MGHVACLEEIEVHTKPEGKRPVGIRGKMCGDNTKMNPEKFGKGAFIWLKIQTSCGLL
jgi:hypothetical protein